MKYYEQKLTLYNPRIICVCDVYTSGYFILA
jgi:hypothetical protein